MARHHHESWVLPNWLLYHYFSRTHLLPICKIQLYNAWNLRSGLLHIIGKDRSGGLPWLLIWGPWDDETLLWHRMNFKRSNTLLHDFWQGIDGGYFKRFRLERERSRTLLCSQVALALLSLLEWCIFLSPVLDHSIYNWSRENLIETPFWLLFQVRGRLPLTTTNNATENQVQKETSEVPTPTEEQDER